MNGRATGIAKFLHVYLAHDHHLGCSGGQTEMRHTGSHWYLRLLVSSLCASRVHMGRGDNGCGAMLAPLSGVADQELGIS